MPEVSDADAHYQPTLGDVAHARGRGLRLVRRGQSLQVSRNPDSPSTTVSWYEAPLRQGHVYREVALRMDRILAANHACVRALWPLAEKVVAAKRGKLVDFTPAEIAQLMADPAPELRQLALRLVGRGSLAAAG